MCFCVFFFFKQKTAYEMRISDWSSDVCSSDLNQSLSRNTWLSWICGSSIPVPVCACSPISRMRCGGGEKRWRSAICSSETRHRCLEQTAAEFLLFAAPPRFCYHIGAAIPCASRARIRSEESRVGKEWVSTCRSGGSPYNEQKKTTR